MTTGTRTRFEDLRWTVAPDAPAAGQGDGVIYLPDPASRFPLLESPDGRHARILRDRARLRRHELARFLVDFDAELAPRQGVPYEVALNPRYGRFTIRTLDGMNSRSILLIVLDHRGITFSSATSRDPQTKIHNRAGWRKQYAALPKRDELFTLLSQRIARHNVKGGHYSD